MEENTPQSILSNELSASLPVTDPPGTPVALLPEHFTEIDINLIKPNPWQPRKIFREENLDELATSIKQHGILQPLVVIPTGDGNYQLIVGERRLRASKIAGLAKVPAIVRDAMTEQLQLELALIENIQRHNLDPIEEATAYKQLMEAYSMTQEQVAQKMGKNRTTVANTLRLLNLPLKIQRAIAEGIISEGHGRAILGVVGMEKQLALFELVVSDMLTVRQVEEKAREIMQRPKMIKAPKTSSDPETMAIENELRGKLGTKVKVQKTGESGKIMIEFFSKEELDAFMDKVHKLE
ncbi:MAG: ParB/RepB/Spo0J family partition protein [Candidatus Doudnabacteria bacterium]|nr:ParB/RepB/Spo0J family partition protein [Candidatus Doudnabacteria bacterium]